MKHLILTLTCLCAFQVVLPAQYIDILDQEEAAIRITRDSMDNFFEKVRPLEVSIQLKNSALDELSREEAIMALKMELAVEVASPTEQQTEILKESLGRALELSEPFTKTYSIPDTIFVGLLKGRLYGENTFYTRENGIFVPASLVKREFQSKLTEILIHEIFHIQSRYNPGLQQKLYKEIGFHPLEEVPEMDSAFRNRILVNPDGTDWNYYIPLSHEGDTVKAYPMIVSNQAEFTEAKPKFFAYLQFQLYPLVATDSGYRVTYSEDFKGLPMEWMPAFFEKIEDNTQYIIHPDEIMADNFILLTKLKAQESHKKLSEDGRALLERLADVYNVELTE